jgi:manganese-dependent inorganic pyrophosphatase
MIKVFGHFSPDTDATCSAIIWAWYLNNHTGTKATPYILGDLNGETKFVLAHFGVETPALLESVESGDNVVVVDTNNPQELFSNINEVTVTEIIDHHKLVGGLTTESPITVTMRPLACTATVMYDIMQTEDIVIAKEIKGLILSAILSDTLAFRSPTTTPHDKDVAEVLAKDLSLDIDSYASEMFTAKSDISDFSDIGLVRLDSKKFEVGGKNIRVSVIETTDPSVVLARKAGIVSAISTLLNEEPDVDDVLFFIVDILNEEATVLTYNDLTSHIVSASFGVNVESDTEVLPGIMSRKKQILPSLKL